MTHNIPKKFCLCFVIFNPFSACIDWDPELRLLAVGTKGGALRIFGAPGVELLGQHEGEELTVLRHVDIIQIILTF